MSAPSTYSSRAHPSVVVDTSVSPGAARRPVAVADVVITGGLLAERRMMARTVSLPGQYGKLEETGRLDNFRRAAGRIDQPFAGAYFNDSDVYKWAEAVAWSLATDPDPELEELLDGVIAEIAAAQHPDGYLNTYFSVDRADQRWTNPDLHELYCAGHLFQAAVAHDRATGKTTLLDVARRFADLICATFGPEDEGKRFWTDGHQEIELALIELGRATGEQRYIDQGQYFIDVRGHRRLPRGWGFRPPAYFQDHEPIRETSEAVGHAVRQLYFASGGADLALERPEPELDAALGRLWESATERKMYVTGGFGARHDGESFGHDFELPNHSAYAETCTSIAGGMWAWRMFLRTGEAHFIDVLERGVYNHTLAGFGQDGHHYFYVNPLEDDGSHRRPEWFGTACCPTNVVRTLALLPGYLYATDDAGGVYVNLYADGDATITRPDGSTVGISQRTDYPWDGTVTLTIETAARFPLHPRVPGWVSGSPRLSVNGDVIDTPLVPGSFASVERDWAAGDTVVLALPMPVRRLATHPLVPENRGRVALQRGPLVYAFEAVDNGGRDVRLAVLHDAPVSERWHPDLLGGIVTLRTEGHFDNGKTMWSGGLYAGSDTLPAGVEHVELTAVPYFVWANREAGPMAVWLRDVSENQRFQRQ